MRSVCRFHTGGCGFTEASDLDLVRKPLSLDGLSVGVYSQEQGEQLTDSYSS